MLHFFGIYFHYYISEPKSMETKETGTNVYKEQIITFKHWLSKYRLATSTQKVRMTLQSFIVRTDNGKGN